MKVSEIYAGTHFKAIDLGGRAHQVQIIDVTSETFDDGEKLVLHFTGRGKTLVCNKTNSAIIAASYGDETDNWIGKTIELYPDKVNFQGQLVDAIRVRIPVPPATVAPTASPTQPPATTEAESFNDDVPW
jgi:hypothetical protein